MQGIAVDSIYRLTATSGLCTNPSTPHTLERHGCGLLGEERCLLPRLMESLEWIYYETQIENMRNYAAIVGLAVG